VTLPAALETFVQQRVASGQYASASDVVREALTLLEHRGREAVLDEVRREIQRGIEQAEAGQLRDGETVLAEIRKKLSLQIVRVVHGDRDVRSLLEN
jgi:antitoxin ParD1/3/4